MARALKTKLVKIKAACDALAISRWTFWMKWHDVFTDPRQPDDRRPGCERKVFEDELSVAVEEGAAAVLTFRRVMNRQGG